MLRTENFIINYPHIFLQKSNCMKKCFRINSPFENENMIFCYPFICDLTSDEYDILIEQNLIKPKQFEFSKIQMLLK